MICLRYSIVTAQKRNKMVSDHPWYITLACLQQEYFQVSISRWIPYPWYFPLIIFQELTTSLLTNYKLLYFGLNVSFLHKHETPIAVVPVCINKFHDFFFFFYKVDLSISQFKLSNDFPSNSEYSASSLPCSTMPCMFSHFLCLNLILLRFLPHSLTSNCMAPLMSL
jgi:hypothetical protein